MNEPTITCPNCRAEVRLTESLAAPLVEATRLDYERRLADKDLAVAEQAARLREGERTLAEARAALDQELAARLEAGRARLAEEEARKARLALGADLAQKDRALAELQSVLEQRELKLAEAQAAQAELLRKQRELDDARRELELTVEKRVQQGLEATREQARREAEEALRLKMAEREQTIAAMQRQIEDLKRKAEQGSQQLQGEVQELALESLLGARFPLDTLEPVGKGERGGDLLQRVAGPLGAPCGAILWESKRTRHWSDAWLPKLREDQRAAKAELAVLVTQTLPKSVETFDLVDGVWVTHPRALLPVAMSLRQTLIEVAAARAAGEGQQTKMEMVYAYLTGPRFRHRVQAIVEAFSDMQQDLDRERKAILKQWAKREEQIARVTQATVGMYGDLQGIAGRTLAEIEGLELPALEPPDEA